MKIIASACLLLLATAHISPAQRYLGFRGTESGGPLMPEQAAYDVTFYDLDLAIDPVTKTIEGSLTTHARILHPTEWFVLHLDTLLSVREVRLLTDGGASKALRYERRGDLLWSGLGTTRQPGSSVRLQVFYGGEPRVAPRPPWVGGFTWAETESGSPWIATSVQGEGADVWWPCKDHPSDEPDSMAIRITVPKPLVVASNGRLRGVIEQEGDLWTYDWFVSTPINNYGVAVNIAPYRTIRDTYTSVTGEAVPVTFWVTPEHYEKGLEIFPTFLTDLAFYEKYLGPYPFRADKYGVAETPHLGMEHQTIIAYGADFTLNRHGFDGLHHHELGHEWWGNLVTALDWRDFWLHEGFCSYMQALYAGELSGMDAYHEAMAPSRPRIRNAKALAPRESKTEGEMYLLPPDYMQSDGDIYNKGKWVLHTLRYLVGDEAFLRSLRRMAYPSPEMETLTDGQQCRFATTDDFRLIAEEESGTNLEWFFEVYARQPALPKLVSERTRNELVLRWDTPNELPFPMPIDVSVDGTTKRVSMTDGSGRVSLTEMDADPVVDPLNWVLKEEG